MGAHLRVLSGEDIVKILGRFGFHKVSQRGSHVKLQRSTELRKETLIIPSHTPVSKKTLKAIFAQASKCISEKELFDHFYTK